MKEIERALFNEKQCRESAARPRPNGYITMLKRPILGNLTKSFSLFVNRS